MPPNVFYYPVSDVFCSRTLFIESVENDYPGPNIPSNNHRPGLGNIMDTATTSGGNSGLMLIRWDFIVLRNRSCACCNSEALSVNRSCIFELISSNLPNTLLSHSRFSLSETLLVGVTVSKSVRASVCESHFSEDGIPLNPETMHSSASSQSIGSKSLI
jgi:hypothetical protein